MAAIGSIRKHSTLLIIIIGVALAAFVLGDFAKGGGGSRNINVGEVEGEEITIMDFNSEAEQNINAQMQQQQKDRLTSSEIFSVKEQTWNDIVHRIIMDNEYEEIGLSVTPDELFDLIQGVNPHPLIKQYFSNPETKVYDRELVIRYLQNMESLPEESKQQWYKFEKYIKNDRMRSKFNALMSKGYYIPKDIAHIAYAEKNDKVELDYVAAKFVDVNDSIFNPTDANYKEYYSENKERYKQKAARDIEYVIFDIVPSAKDIQSAKKEIDQIAIELKETVDVVRFLKVNSDTPYDSSWFALGKLPVQIDSAMFNSEVGYVSEPYKLNDAFHVARLMQVGQRPDSMKASHILIAYAGAYNAQESVTRIKIQAKVLADSLLTVLVKKPSIMTTLAKEFSNDPSVAQNDSDLGWFADGQMVPAFNKAVYDTKVGKFTLVETPFGYHIIEVTGKQELEKKVKVAMLDLEIYASDATYQNTYAKASKIATECDDEEDFNTAVTDARINKRTMPAVREMSNYIAGLNNPRQIVRWAFNEDVKVGDVSSVFDLEDMFVVAILTGKKDEGYPSMDEVKDRIKPHVYKELKGEYFVDKMKTFNGDLSKIKAGMDVTEKEVKTITFDSRNLPGFSTENIVIGSIFGMSKDAVSQPIIGNAGVFVVKIKNVTLAKDIDNYSKLIADKESEFQKVVDRDSPFNALKESLDIIDNRLEFY